MICIILPTTTDATLAPPDLSTHVVCHVLFQPAGSFKRVNQNAGGDRKRVSSTLTRVWSSLISYFRPAADVVHSAFRPIPFIGMYKFKHNKKNHRGNRANVLEDSGWMLLPWGTNHRSQCPLETAFCGVHLD